MVPPVKILFIFMSELRSVAICSLLLSNVNQSIDRRANYQYIDNFLCNSMYRVGAIDSIVDVIGTLLALHHLSVITVSCSRIPMGEGTVWTDHGQLPVPAFATMRLLIGMKTCKGPGDKNGTVTGELVTPTAAALLRVLTGVADAEREQRVGKKGTVRMGRPPNFTPRAVGLGAGTKDFIKHPNVIRLILGDEVMDDDVRLHHQSAADILLTVPDLVQKEVKSEELVVEKTEGKASNTTSDAHAEKSEVSDEFERSPSHKHDTRWNVDKLTLVQANIDDITAEVLSHTLDLLLKNDAIDAWVEPIVMKKGRSAHTLNCLFHSQEGLDGKLMEIIFKNTTTLGIPIQRDIERASLHRKMIQVQTLYGVGNKDALDGIVNVKLGLMGDEVVSVKAEFEDCKAISEATGVPIKKIADCATSKAQEQISYHKS